MRDRSGQLVGTVLVATDLREMRRLLAEAQAPLQAENAAPADGVALSTTFAPAG